MEMKDQAPKLLTLSIAEAVREGAKDIPTFGHIWFPRTMRQASPLLHYDMSAVLENPENRHIGLEVFRDGAKTTMLRAYAAKRMAYCISRTILLVNINAGKAEHSLRWLKRQVEYNKSFAGAFNLRRGDKWTDAWSTFINAEDEVINVLAMGITSGLRGINIDDFRPDFILCDDICDAENMATEESRAKVQEVFFAQLVRSLSPKSESPMAQIAMAQTPINSFDLISQAKKDPTFHVFSYSCFDASGQSAWPARRSTDELLKEKQGYINRNQLSMWLAEMECTIVSTETQAFNKEWLQRWQVLPVGGRWVIAVDPASSEEKAADFFAIALLYFHGKKVYVVEYSLQRGMMPDAACNVIFGWVLLYGVRDLVVETVAYQKILKWYIEQEMAKRRVFINVHSYDDKRRKDDRIVQAITQCAPYGEFYIRDGMTELEEIFELYGPSYSGKVDLIDAISIGISWKTRTWIRSDDDALDGEFQRLRQEDEELDPVDSSFQGAP